MQTLNLDPGFSPVAGTALNFKAMTFYGGEPHIKIEGAIQSDVPATITHRIKSFNDLGLVIMAADAVRRMGVRELHLIIPYFPGARQDRLMVTGEPLSVKVYAEIINSLKFDTVTIYDPHSDVAPALIDNVKVVNNHDFIRQVLGDIGKDVKLVAPDSGALKKIYKLSEYLGGMDVVECTKSRDVATGKLSGFKVQGGDLEGADCLIVDDICDGGGTFAGIASALKAKGAGRLYLAVSHGIFSKGFDVFTENFETVYTTNAFRDVDNGIVRQIELKF